jgi:phosphate transport system protein
MCVGQNSKRTAIRYPQFTMPRVAGRKTKSKPKVALTEVSERVAQGIRIVADAIVNLRDFASTGSRMALLAVRDCERELDQLERDMDEIVPAAITRAGEAKARELLACLRFASELERIGDLLLWVAEKSASAKLNGLDSERLDRMLDVEEQMMTNIQEGFSTRDVSKAYAVLGADPELDRLRTAVFQDHLQRRKSASKTDSVGVLFMIQTVERVGDHATNLAEELVHLIEERTIRHSKARVVDG